MNDLRLLPGSGTRGSVCLPVNKVWSYITYGASARGGSKTSRTGKHWSQLVALACNKVPIWVNYGKSQALGWGLPHSQQEMYVGFLVLLGHV